MNRPDRVQLVEVGMRDGFQMEAQIVPTATKIAIGNALISAGVKQLELTSFVSPKLVPQLSDAAEVVTRLRGRGALLRALVPNQRGAERAVSVGTDAVVIFMSASETHNLKNVNRTVAQSMKDAAGVAAVVKGTHTRMQGAIATAFGCPFEGDIGVAKPLAVAKCYAALGIEEVTLGDTTGMATPRLVTQLCERLCAELPEIRFSLHFHNTRGIAMANVLAGLDIGIDSYESSFGGLGGCPFAVGATGNICSEDLLFLFEELGIGTGVDLDAMIGIAKQVEALFGRPLPGQVMKAGRRLPLAPCTTLAGARHRDC